MKKRKILITGVAGFIASNLAQKLLEVYNSKIQIIGIDNLSYGLRKQVPPGVEFHKLDIRSKEIYPLFDGVDCVFHLAAKNCITDCQENPFETSDINTTGTINVFEASRLASVRKIIHAESSAVYEGSSLFPTPESEEWPISFYACSKLSAGYYAKSYSTTYGMNITGLRYFNVYGPRQDYRRSIPPVICAFIIALLNKKQPIIYGSGEKRRDFIYVDDVNAFHICVMDDDRTKGNVYNLGCGINYSINEIYGQISELLNSDTQPKYIDDISCEAKITLADISKARKLGWTPKVDIREGLTRSIHYIRNNVVGKIL